MFGFYLLSHHVLWLSQNLRQPLRQQVLLLWHWLYAYGLFLNRAQTVGLSDRHSAITSLGLFWPQAMFLRLLNDRLLFCHSSPYPNFLNRFNKSFLLSSSCFSKSFISVCSSFIFVSKSTPSSRLLNSIYQLHYQKYYQQDFKRRTWRTKI